MYTDYGPLHALPYRLRSARQKRRAQKEDFAKRLIQLDKQRGRLRADKANLPWIPLPEPYQKGWKRSFILREDVRRSKYAEFYQALLDKINTVQFNTDKTFRVKTKRWGKKLSEVKTQSLQEFSISEWNSPELKLTDMEKQFFYPRETWCWQSKRIIIQYVYAEPWRFVLQVRPHMITEVKMFDADLESQIRRLDNLIENNHLNCKIYKMTRSRRASRKSRLDIKQKYRHPFNNMPLYRILEGLKEQKTD